MFWDIFFQSLTIIVFVMIVGYAVDFICNKLKGDD